MVSKFLLGIDTTGSRLNLGLDNFAGVSRIISLPLGRALSTDLHYELQAFMEPQQWQELEAIAIIVGPGSYTGSRLGVVTARTLAQSLDIPLYGFSSLAIASLISTTEMGAIAISIPAQRNHVYGAIYNVVSLEHEPQWLQSDTNLKLEAWADLVSGVSSHPHSIEFKYTEESSTHLINKMIAIAKAKLDAGIASHWSTIVPNYAK